MIGQHLKSDSTLQGGKYKIEKVLGQGGFGITYLASQEFLGRQVCIKEFFFKDCCERDEATSRVLLGTVGSREMVERFMSKFIKEARTISQLDHPNIIRIHDIFMENDTAYYVMDYIEGESLSEMVNKQGALSEAKAVDYIKQIAGALDFIHQGSINHLDVKPANIMVRHSDDKAILIDFGLSKQYDEQGSQTSTTPVGISHGYAPMEQYKQGGVSTFSPQTDIYALGATLFKIITGNTPPQAMDIVDEGLPSLPGCVSSPVADAIRKAMQPRKIDRPKTITDWLGALSSAAPVTSDTYSEKQSLQSTSTDEETRIIEDDNQAAKTWEPVTVYVDKEKKNKNLLIWMIVITILGFGGYFIYQRMTLAKENVRIEEAFQERQRLREKYNSLIKDGDNYFAAGNYVSAANSYGHAYNIEKEYRHTLYADEFNAGANDKHARALQADKDAKMRAEQDRQRREAAERAEQHRRAAAKAEEERELAEYKRTHGSINGYEYADLGLSVKWATCNIGANTPEDYGNYYDWSEISTVSDGPSYYSETFHRTMNIDIGGNPKYDAARANWGGSWRLPTKKEMEELINNCKWYRMTRNGIYGCDVVGPNGNSIFLPAAGYRFSSIYLKGTNGLYWSSTPNSNDFGISPSTLEFDAEKIKTHYRGRTHGLAIRPVSY